MIVRREKEQQEPIFLYDPLKEEWQTIYIPLTKQRQQELDQVQKKQVNYQPKPKKFIKKSWKKVK